MMKIKRKMPKLASVLLCFSMVSSNLLPAYATEAVVTETSLEEAGENGNNEPENDTVNTVMLNDDVEPQADNDSRYKEIQVNYSQSSTYFVTIPKTITLGADKKAAYSVKVEGDIVANKQVCVVPVDGIEDTEVFDFYMADQIAGSTKEDVVAEVSQAKFYWNHEETAAGYTETDNYVIADSLSAGKWKGTFQMEISMRTDPAHIHNYVGEVTKEPTCTEKGEKTYTCDCGDSYIEEIPAKGHHYENGECTDCGEKDPSHEHSYTETITKEPTCTEKGEKTYTCDCGDSYTEEIPAKGHHFEDGECTDCGEKDPDYHKHSYTETVTKEPTCTEAGEKTYTCDCGDSYTEEIPAKGHHFVDDECTDCGEKDPSHVHTYVPYELMIEPQLVSSTKGVYPTNSAKYTKWTNRGSKDGYTDFYVNSICTGGNTGSQFNATAEITLPDDYEGEYDYKYYFTYTMGCSDKGAAVRLLLNGNLVHRYSNGQVVSAIGSANSVATIPLHAGKNTIALQAHFYNASGSTNPDPNRYNWYDVYLENITLFDGTEYHICNECGKKEKHVLEETVTRLATCTEAGEKIYTCSICGGQFTEEIPATGHNYVEGVCDKCGDLDLKLTTTTVFSASTSTSTTTDSGHGHYDQAILNGTYSDEIEITEDMGENDYLNLYFTVTRPNSAIAAVDPVSGSSMLQKYDEETGTWKTIYSYSMSYSNLTDFSMRNAEGGGGNGRTEWISRNFQLEKGKYRVYGQFTGKKSCASSVAHNYWFYSIRASLCRMELNTDTETP